MKYLYYLIVYKIKNPFDILSKKNHKTEIRTDTWYWVPLFAQTDLFANFTIFPTYRISTKKKKFFFILILPLKNAYHSIFRFPFFSLQLNLKKHISFIFLNIRKKLQFTNSLNVRICAIFMSRKIPSTKDTKNILVFYTLIQWNLVFIESRFYW